MIKRYPCQIVVMAILGIVLAGGYYMAVLPAVLLAGIWVYREPIGKTKLRQTVVLLLAFGLGAARMGYVSAIMDCQLAGLADGQAVSVQGCIVKKQCKETEIKAESWAVYLKDSRLKDSQGIRPCGNIIVYLNTDEPVIGNTILVSGNIKLFRTARNDGNFDERAYYQDQGYSFKVYAKQGQAYQAVSLHTDRLREFLYSLQQAVLQIYDNCMPRQEAGALGAMLLGDKSLLLSQTKELYRQSGIAHILAISGLHISILGAGIFRLLRKGRVSYVSASAVSLGMLIMFGLMSGMGSSAIRAIVMFGLYLGASCCGRAYDSANGLAVAAACLLLQNPRVLFLAGFQFSFAAVLGVLFGKEICRICRPKFRLTETVLISFGIQMLTLPLTAWYYYEIPIYSVLLNMLVLPWMGLVLVMGLFGGSLGVLAGTVSGMQAAGVVIAAGQLCGMVSKGLLFVCTQILSYFTKAGNLFLHLPGAVCVTGQPKNWQMTGYYFMLLGCVWILNHRVQGTYRKAGGNQVKENQEKACLKRQKAAVGLCCFICLVCLFVQIPKRAEVAVLDVGQGDGIYIRTSDGMDIFIDGGSNDVSQAGTYRILPFLKSQGVSGIDYWFVSHLDQDHISGLKEIAESGYPIGQVVFAEGILKDDAYQELTDTLTAQQIGIQHVGKGSRLCGHSASFLVLSPNADASVDDRNARSLVLLYEDAGFCGFFSGDISTEEEQALVLDGSLPHITFYKAAHHGSNHSNSEALLSRLKPSVSVVSCALKNSYGHPGREAAARIEADSGQTCYTMYAGQIRVWMEQGSVKVKKKISY